MAGSQVKTKTPPTSAEIRRIVEQAVKKVVCPEIKELKASVKYLMDKDHDAEVIAAYLKKHPEKRRHIYNQDGTPLGGPAWLDRELVKALLWALLIIGALVGAKLWPSL